MSKSAQSGGSLFRGFMLAQLGAALVISAGCALFLDLEHALIALWGGTVSVLAHAWAGYQLWLHPRLRDPRHQAGAAIRAEFGKVVVILLLLWLSFSKWAPLREELLAAGTLLTGFFVTQVIGWIWLVRATGAAAPPSSGNNTLDG